MAKIIEWLWFFRRNRDYWRYCKAKQLGRVDVCQQLEASFPRIAELYADWGDIHASNLVSDAEAQRKWWVTRARLFIDFHGPTWIEDPATYVHRPGHLLVEIPLLDTKAATMRAFDRYLGLQYMHRQRALTKSTKPAVRLVMQPRSGPKYRLHPDGAKPNAATKRALAKAAYVDQLRRQRRVDGNQLSLTDTVLAIKQDPKNPFGWSMTEQDKRDMAKGVFKKGLYAGSEITLIKRARKDFDAYVRNTIHGRFPDNS